MHSQNGREPLASKLADDLENPRFISGHTDLAAQVGRVELAVCARRGLDLIV